MNSWLFAHVLSRFIEALHHHCQVIDNLVAAVDAFTMKNPIKKYLRLGKASSGSATQITNPNSPSVIARLESTLEPPAFSSQSTPNPPALLADLPPLPASSYAPLPTPLPASLATHPDTPHVTAAAYNVPLIPSAMIPSSAQNVNVSRSTFNQAGRDLIYHNYQFVNRMCSLVVLNSPET